jgi:hypothetical protein
VGMAVALATLCFAAFCCAGLVLASHFQKRSAEVQRLDAPATLVRHMLPLPPRTTPSPGQPSRPPR